ncbi:hypothetical protein BBUCA112A_J0038 (plasmid) [Borreliella burgdorferi CA-11.2A]|nr:hypothetical protein BBUCA112A_J0038 [Borreliella burgdorferi CA-11.2A]PRR32146.1 hypothetical protein CV693_05565 [Borreliella burgdorferi]
MKIIKRFEISMIKNKNNNLKQFFLKEKRKKYYVIFKVNYKKGYNATQLKTFTIRKNFWH